MDIRISGLIDESIVDGPGIRFVIFTQGCSHNCPGCHNPQTHDYKAGSLMTTDEIIQSFSNNILLDGITLSGGEPFEQAEACAEIARGAKDLGLNVIVYSGYTFEILYEKSKKTRGIMNLLNTADILIDGRFEIDKRNISLNFRGSENQRIIDLKKSMREYEANGSIITMEM